MKLTIHNFLIDGDTECIDIKDNYKMSYRNISDWILRSYDMNEILNLHPYVADGYDTRSICYKEILITLKKNKFLYQRQIYIKNYFIFSFIRAIS